MFQFASCPFEMGVAEEVICVQLTGLVPTPNSRRHIERPVPPTDPLIGTEQVSVIGVRGPLSCATSGIEIVNDLAALIRP